jgi:misacylated tRNA(Ala) deacylase
MMTESIFHANSYIKDFDAVVTAVDETTRAVVLDRTAFFPGGGGQLCDLGTLASAGEIWAVEKVRNGPGGIEHILAGESPLPTPGELATGKLDWGRRYRLMRTHTAMHILCGVIFRDFGAQVTGGDMDLKQGRMDFEFESMTRDLVEVIEASVNLEVEKNLPVRVKILPRDEAFQIPDLIRTKINLLPPGIPEVRTVEIVGLDLQADGGTHVASTGEVGQIRIVDYKSKGRINKRIYIELG